MEALQTEQFNQTDVGMQVLSFVLDHDWFGVEISGIQEVLEYREVTKVPRTPEFMLGVINLRGKVIPVVDLRRQFGMNIASPTIDSCIIIIDVEVDGESTAMGIMADQVQEVVELSRGDINPPPRIGNKIDSSFIDGIARQDEQFLILLKLSAVFSDDQWRNVLVAGADSSATAPSGAVAETDI